MGKIFIATCKISQDLRENTSHCMEVGADDWMVYRYIDGYGYVHMSGDTVIEVTLKEFLEYYVRDELPVVADNQKAFRTLREARVYLKDFNEQNPDGFYMDYE